MARSPRSSISRSGSASPQGEGRTAQSRIIVAEIGDNQLGIIVDAVEDVMRISRTSISAAAEDAEHWGRGHRADRAYARSATSWS